MWDNEPNRPESEEMMPRPTPFHSRTHALGKASRWEEWAGYLSPTMYDLDHLHEYNAVRTGCALFDVSPLYKYDVSSHVRWSC